MGDTGIEDMKAHIEAAVERYVSLIGKPEVDELVGLFAADATVEDPVGSDVHRGHEALRAFYGVLPEMGAVAESPGPINVCGNEVAFGFQTGTGDFRMPVIDHMVFDDDGKIASMRAFWSF